MRGRLIELEAMSSGEKGETFDPTVKYGMQEWRVTFSLQKGK